MKELLEMGLNCVHEVAHSLYIKHVYNGDVYNGDALFGAGRNILVEERVDNAVKRVQNLTTTAKATYGHHGRGGITFGTRGGGRRGGFGDNYNGGRQPQYIHNDYINDYMPN
jgi:hypothetical protein